MRLFIAVELPEKIIAVLKDLQQEIRSKVEKGRFKQSENFHLTLKFLGETGADTTKKLIERLPIVANEQHAFDLQLGQAGIFGSRQPIRVIWLGLGGDLQRLAQLQSSVEQECTQIGFMPERRAYSPHITLAQDVIPRQGEQYLPKETPQLSFTVHEFALVLSEERNRKRIYTPIHVFRLK